jgi:hypothetical protein
VDLLRERFGGFTSSLTMRPAASGVHVPLLHCFARRFRRSVGDPLKLGEGRLSTGLGAPTPYVSRDVGLTSTRKYKRHDAAIPKLAEILYLRCTWKTRRKKEL